MLKAKFYLVVIAMLLAFSTDAQTYIHESNYRYFVGTQEPPTDWKTTGFDASEWNIGTGTIGFGDSDDDTEITQAISAYIRLPFTIENKRACKELVMLCDFDDGFVAYINGHEFARVNMGEHGSETTFNQLTDRSHEAEIYRDNSYNNFVVDVLGYYIDYTFIKNYIVSGTNILAVEVHNDSATGSDLSLNCEMVDISDAQGLSVLQPEGRYKKCVQLDSTRLPILIIETGEFGVPVKRIEVPGTLAIVNNGFGSYNKPTDTPNNYNGPIEIEVRGESSSIFPKRSYDFELQDVNGNDTNISLLGMPKENDWVLQGPYADKSQIRNALIYDLARKSGQWSPRVKFCEVIINGEYVGLYNLIEKIKRDSNRVYVAKLRPEEISGIDLTGGYIVKYDKGADGIQIVYPKEKDIQPEQIDYIQGLFDDYISVVNSSDGLDPIIGYKKYINENSLIDNIIIAEFGKNCDSYVNSSFMYKDRDDRNNKIMFGPIWDFDLCFGNSIWQDGDLTHDWQFDFPLNSKFMIKRLFEDPELADKFESRWNELRQSYLSNDSVFHTIDTLLNYLEKPIARNNEVWPVIDKEYFFNAYEVSSFDEEINRMKNWIQERTTWIDDNIADIYYPVSEYTGTNSFENSFAEVNVYPNPFVNQLTIDVSLPGAGNLKVRILNSLGQTIDLIQNQDLTAGEYTIMWFADNYNLPAGYYILDVRLNKQVLDQKLLIKKE